MFFHVLFTTSRYSIITIKNIWYNYILIIPRKLGLIEFLSIERSGLGFENEMGIQNGFRVENSGLGL